MSKTIIKLLLYIILFSIPFTSVLIIHNNSHSWGGDFALYINQAKSLLGWSMENVLNINKFGLENSTYSYYSPELYPWGWPILLAPIISTVGVDYIFLKLWVMFFFVGTAVIYFLLFRKNTGNIGGVLITMVFLFNPALIDYTNTISPCFPFLFFSLMSFLVYNNYLELKEVGWVNILFSGFIFFFVTTIRSEGFLVVSSIFITELVRITSLSIKKKYIKKEYNWFCKVFSIFITLQLLHKLILPQGSSSHFSHFSLMSWETIKGNVVFYFVHLDYLFSFFLKESFVVVTFPFIITGLYKSFNKDMAICIYFLLLHILFIIWPHHEIRYLFLIAPFYFYFLYQGFLMSNLIVKVRKTTVNIGVIVFSVFTLIMLTDFYFYSIRKSNNHEVVEGPSTKDAQEMFSFIEKNTKSDDIITFFKPRVMTLYTKRKSCIIHKDSSKLLEVGGYVVLHKNMGGYNQIYYLINHDSKWLDKRFENKTFIIYHIKT